MKPTTEQQAIIAAARSGSNLVIQAGAGTGKTSTLRMVAGELRRPSLYIAYNRSIAQEAAGSFPKHVESRTAHSLAMRAVGWRYRHRLSGGRQTSKRGVSPLAWWGFGRPAPRGRVVEGCGVGHRVVISELPTKVTHRKTRRDDPGPFCPACPARCTQVR